MNKAILVGRMVRDPEPRSTANGVSVCSFTVACDRRFVKQGEERSADFINCIAWRKTGESIAQYFKKGDRIGLEGSIQTRSWTDNDGKTRYATEIVVEQWEFAQSKTEGGRVPPGAAKFPDSKPTEKLSGDLDGFMPIDQEDFPF